MDRSLIAADHVVDRYVMNKLTSDELEAFEIALLDDPNLQNQVDIARAMQSSLKVAKTALEAKPSRSPLMSMLATPAFGATAAALCLLSLFTSAMLFSRLGAVNTPSPPELSSVNEVRMEQVRGESGGIEIDLSKGPTILRFDVGPLGVENFKVKLTDGARDFSDEVIVHKASDNSLTILLQNLNPSTYDVVVSVLRADGTEAEIGVYRVEITQ